MPRTFAPVKTSIWSDDDFVALDPDAQRLYFLLLSQQQLSMVGVVAYTPRRWARFAAGTTTDDIEQAVHELVAARFVVVDRDTEEILVRTLVRHDPARGSKSLIALWRSWLLVESELLRQAIVEEIPNDLWTDPKAPPPQEAKHLRNAPSNTPSGAPCDAASEAPSDGARAHARAGARGLLPPASCLPSSSSENGSGIAREPSADDDETRFRHIIDAIVDRRLAAARARGAIANEVAWRRATRKNLIHDHGQQIREQLATHADAAIIDALTRPTSTTSTPSGQGPERVTGANPDYGTGAGHALAGGTSDDLEELIAHWPTDRQAMARHGFADKARRTA